MRRVLVRYRVKPDRVEDNERLVRAVYAELREKQPDGLRYATFKGSDGVTFFHLASIEAETNPLSEIAAFKEFQRDIKDRCDEPPTPTDLETIGHYGLFE